MSNSGQNIENLLEKIGGAISDIDIGALSDDEAQQMSDIISDLTADIKDIETLNVISGELLNNMKESRRHEVIEKIKQSLEDKNSLKAKNQKGGLDIKPE